jgi:serine/threonine protein phosphatase 1
VTVGGRLFAVGDVHGCADELEALLRGLPLERGDTVAFVGDYIDRGPDSRAAVDVLLALRARDELTTVFLKGNHEDMCLAYLGRHGSWGDAWHLNGGTATLRSYGLPPSAPPADVATRLPPAHLAFFEDIRTWHRTGDFLVVHAGIRPGLPLEQQDEEDLFWIREEFIAARHGLPYTVVFGHTPQRRVLVDLPWKIGIDTGCVYGGWLTAIELGEGRLYQVAYGDERVRESRLRAA